MRRVIKLVENLKNKEVSKLIKKRIKEFEDLGQRDNKEIFKELCYCILTANFNALKSIEISKEINDGFLFLSLKELTGELYRLGHRFPNMRSKFIFDARKYSSNLKEILNSFKTEYEMRDWLVKNIKGYGLKEASHFLRNIGKKNLAIIDFHIIDFLVRNKLIAPLDKKALNRKKYLEIEKKLLSLSKKLRLTLGELDLYLWYSETGNVLK
ncbi:N-glycosylase/DNA lyase [Patescibacteria group bacterium]|nr:N-glycosylase/DNA lyase [Patescibacteria group bacterium]